MNRLLRHLQQPTPQVLPARDNTSAARNPGDAASSCDTDIIYGGKVPVPRALNDNLDILHVVRVNLQ